MVAIITEKFKLHNVEQFTESFSESSASTYYMFIGKSTEFSGDRDGTGATDTTPPTPLDSVSDEFYFFDQMIAGLKRLHPQMLSIASLEGIGQTTPPLTCTEIIIVP